MNGRKAIVPGVKKIGEHAPEVEVHETRLTVQEKGPVGQHLLERNQEHGQLGGQRSLAGPPLVEAAATELPLLVPSIGQLFSGRNEFPKVSVVELEGQSLDVVLDVAPDNPLQAVPLGREQAQLQFRVEILGDDLRVLIHLEKRVAPIL